MYHKKAILSSAFSKKITKKEKRLQHKPTSTKSFGCCYTANLPQNITYWWCACIPLLQKVYHKKYPKSRAFSKKIEKKLIFLEIYKENIQKDKM